MSVVLLNEAKIDPNSKNTEGDTPLYLACRKKNLKIVRLLISDPRCNTLEKNNKGDTTLHEACRLPNFGEANTCTNSHFT